MFGFITILFCLVIRYKVEAKLQEEAIGEVIFVNLLFRHGDRDIIKPYPDDPNKDASNWPDGLGQLTNIGKRQEFALGQWLRQRYDDILTERYSRDLVYVRSTDVDRTLMSSKCVLAGMYPPNGSQVWNKDLPWQPIPTHTIPQAMDKVLAQKFPCPAYDQERQRVLSSPEIANITARYSNIMPILSEFSGNNITSLHDICGLYSDLYIEKLKNLTVPNSLQNLFPTLYEASAYCFALPTWNKKLARLKSGLLVQELLNNMIAKKNHLSTLNVKIYSCHDSTVASLLNTLGVFDRQVPPYSATIMMELREDDQGQHRVTLYYRNSTTVGPYLLTVPGCSTACPLDQLINLTLPVIPDDWDKECQLDQ